MAALIGALRVSLSADTAAFSQGMQRAQRQAADSSTAIQRSLGGIKTAVGGFLAGISLGTIAAAAERALNYAASLGEVSQQLGVTTRDLQVYRYAATQVGISQEEMDKGLARLTLSMGKAQAGSKPIIAAFNAIGISVTELRGRTAGDVLPMIAEGLAKIGDDSGKAAVGAALMGKNFQTFMPLLEGGRGTIDELSNAAEDLGIVLSDDQIQNADKTADKLAQLKLVMEARIAGVVADNAGAIDQFASSLGNLVGVLGAVVKAYNWAQDQAPMLFGAVRAATNPAGFLLEQAGRLINRPKTIGRQTADGGLEIELGAPKPARKPRGGAIPDFLAGGGAGKGRTKKAPKGKSGEQLAREAERRREQALRDDYRFASDQRRNQIDMLQAQMDLAHDYSDRASLSIAILDLEREQERSALSHAVAMRDMTQAQANQLEAQLEVLDGLKRRKLLEDEQYERWQGEVEVLRAESDIQRQLLAGSAAMAETAAERRAVELRILDLAYRQERARLQAVLDDERASHEAKQIARLQMGALGQRRQQDEAAVLRGSMGPMEMFMSSLPNTAAKANEALESIAANGLQSLTDGITEAIMGAKSLGDAFKNVAKQIIADLIRIAVQRAIVAPIANAIGSFVPGFGGFGGNTGSAKLPGFATGGTIKVGGFSGVDRNLLSLNGLPIAKVSMGERIQVDPANSSRGGGVALTINAPGATAETVMMIRRELANAAPAIAAASTGQTLRTLRRPGL